MAHPTIVFCHGAWHNVRFFDKVIRTLEALGYRCVAVPLPSASGRIPPTTSLDEDIAAIRNVVLEELVAGRDVVMNAHSWGGIPMSTALDGLTKLERLADGERTGVVKMTYVSAFVLPEATSLKDFVGGTQPTWNIDTNGNLTYHGDLRELFYHDVDPKEAEEWLAQLKPQSLASFTTKTISAAWKRIPSAYLVCEDDRLLPVFLQDLIVANMKEAGAEIETTRLFSSHSPYLNRPDAVVDFLRTAIEKAIT